MDEHILKVEDLNIFYQAWNGWFQAIQGVSFGVKRNEVFGIVGESGSGKSTLCMGLLKLLPASSRTEAGGISFDGKNLPAISGEALRQLRWREISYIPQSAMNTLNPVMPIRSQFYDTITDHEGKRSQKELDGRIADALAKVGLKPGVAGKYAHELSGGMKQRVCIAMAMLLNPKLIIADEPTSALDVISQRTVLEILSDVRKKLSASMILVGHDMAIQAQIADRMGIMYAGYFVEIGSVEAIFNNPVHPYTRSLIKAIPSIRKKQDIHMLAAFELSEREREKFKTRTALLEVSPGHFAASFE